MKVIDINTFEVLEDYPDIDIPHSYYTTKKYWEESKVNIKEWENRQRKLLFEVIEK